MKNLNRLIFLSLILATPVKAKDDILDVLNDLIDQIEDQDFNNTSDQLHINCPIIMSETRSLSSNCVKKTTPQLRNLFKSFNTYTNAKHDSTKLSKLMAIMIKESSANPSAISDMKGRGSSYSYRSFFKLNNSKGIMSRDHFSTTQYLEMLLDNNEVKFDKQTNFGLSQLSADRLLIPKWGGNYLKQSFTKFEKFTSKDYIQWCLTKSIYNDKDETLESYYENKIKNCTPNAKTKKGIKCFARNINFCPRLSIELSLKQPMRYFETRHAKSICSNLFN